MQLLTPHTQTHSLPRTHTQTHTLSLAHTQTQTHTQTHTLSLSLSHTHTHIHTRRNDEMQRLTSISKASACGMLISLFVPPKDDKTLSKIVSLLVRTLQNAATNHSTLLHTATHPNTLRHVLSNMTRLASKIGEASVRDCNTLQQIATHCNTT